jgi:hypothetical protein
VCKIDNREFLTALVSVATAAVTNIMEKVTIISMISACHSEPDGVVVPRFVIGWSSTLRVNDANMEPLT